MKYHIVISVMGIILYASALRAEPPREDAQARAMAEIQAQRTEGLIAVGPWVQLMENGMLGVGWLTDRPADGLVEWTQEPGPDAVWRQAWYSEDGLRQANGTVQRAVIRGTDPAKPVRLRAVSRPIVSFQPYQVVFGEPVVSQERTLPAVARPDGTISMIVFNDIHNRARFYPLLTRAAGPDVHLAVFNGDVLEDPQLEEDLIENLLLPMSWFAAQKIPCFFVRGNHETRGAYARQLKSYLALSQNRYYGAMTLGSMRILFLDSGEDKPDTSKEYSGLVDFDTYLEEELTWLQQELSSKASTDAVWRVVVVHIPPDWRKEEAQLWHGERRMRERFAPLFDAGRVHVVISGHTHHAEWIQPCPDATRGFRWPVVIGGAHPLDKATVIRVDATPEKLMVKTLNASGAVIAEQVWKPMTNAPPSEQHSMR